MFKGMVSTGTRYKLIQWSIVLIVATGCHADRSITKSDTVKYRAGDDAFIVQQEGYSPVQAKFDPATGVWKSGQLSGESDALYIEACATQGSVPMDPSLEGSMGKNTSGAQCVYVSQESLDAAKNDFEKNGVEADKPYSNKTWCATHKQSPDSCQE